MTRRILDATRLDVYLHDVGFESVSELLVRHAAAFDYEHRYADYEHRYADYEHRYAEYEHRYAEYEHEYEHENASKGGVLVD